MLDSPAPPSNASLSARDIAYHMHPFTNARRLESRDPFVSMRGAGIRVFDEAGRDYIDAMAGLWCASLGFSEKRLAEAAYKQMKELPFYHSFAGKVPAISTELAERLIGIAPAGMGQELFPTTAPEGHVKAIRT